MPENKCQDACPLTPRVEALEEANKQHSNTHREIFTRLNDVERDSAVQEAHYKQIIEKLDNLTNKVEALEAKPGRRWDGIVDKAVWAVLAAVIAFLLGRVGL